jgi:murein DD-endopeptidase MepM/ murein hydrolase activator NlpD
VPLLVAVVIAALALVVPGPSRPGWAWPVGTAPLPPVVLTPFDPPAQPWLAGHRGVDLAATVGDPVLAAGPGMVVFAGRVAGRGVVTVAHGAGLRTTYEPVAATVAVGQVVRGGDVLGTVEPGAHCGAEACVHWGALRNGRYVDPLALLRTSRVRLLPASVPRGAPAQALGCACW